MSVGVEKQYAANMQCAPTLPEVTCARVSLNTPEMREQQTVAVTSMSARLWNDLAVCTLYAKMQNRALTAFVLKVTEPNQIHKSLANR